MADGSHRKPFLNKGLRGQARHGVGTTVVGRFVLGIAIPNGISIYIDKLVERDKNDF
jgi:hypothetical protein